MHFSLRMAFLQSDQSESRMVVMVNRVAFSTVIKIRYCR